jgi:hypothetical protein
MTHSHPPAPTHLRRRTLLGVAIAAIAGVLAPRRARARSRSAHQRAGQTTAAKRPIWIGHL